MWQLGLLLLCIAVWIPTAADGDTSQSDVSALNVLFNTLNSPPQLTGWSSNGGDPCGQSWRGITCSGSAVTDVKLSGLGLNGTLGYMLASMVSLTTFDLSNNNIGFGSAIPYGLPPNVQRLDLSGNAFDGALPYSISLMPSLKYLNVSHNQLDGILSDIFSKLSSLCTLDISYNNFSGIIPRTFSALSSLTTLYLQNNQFIGTVDVLVDLPLEYLNIMNNHFTGGIPDQLKRVKNIQIDGSSWNSGPAAPASPDRKTNPGQNSGGGQTPSSKGVGSKSNMGMAGVAGAAILGLVLVSVIVFFIINKKSKPALNKKKLQNGHPYTPRASDTSGKTDMQKASNTAIKTEETATLANLKPPPIDRYKSSEEDDTPNKVTTKKTNIALICAKSFSVADLQLATDSFNMENVIGEGSLGRVYRAQFDDGKVLAVKKVSPSAFPSQSSEDFLELVSCLSQLRHPNVTTLAGYCCEHGQHLLIFEFLSNGSLQDLLHFSDEFINPLSWTSRIKIALGTARALEYLHEVCFPPIIHKNFKSGNILLDEEFNPRLSDSGFSSLNFSIEFEGLDQNMGFGYSAPEVMSGQYTVKSDIYSFGVVMLELLTGRKPFDSSRHRSEQSLVQWAAPQLHDIDALDKMVDPTLKGMYPAKSLSRFADVIALCVQPGPEFRPPMSEVVQSLVRLVQRANTGRRTGTADEVEVL